MAYRFIDSCVRSVTVATMMVLAAPADAALNCDTGTSLGEVAQYTLGVQRGAETLDDVNLALGLIPEAIISERVRTASENASGVLEKIERLRAYCRLIAAKSDPLEQYFQGIDLLFSSTPMAAWVSQDLAMARIIVNGARNIATGVLSDTLNYSEGVGVRVTVTVSRYRRILWNEPIQGRSLRDANHLRSARLLAKPKLGGATIVRSLNVGFDSASPTAYEVLLNLGDFLNDAGISASDHRYFFEFVWKNGQRSVVPLAPGFYQAGYLNVIFPFVLKSQSMVLDR